MSDGPDVRFQGKIAETFNDASLCAGQQGPGAEMMGQVHSRWVGCLGIAVVMASSLALGQQPGKPPETFLANAQVSGQNAGASAMVTIQIDRYTDPRDITSLQEALKLGGYPGFLPALRKAPVVGSVEMNGRKVSVRWARQVTNEKGRSISIVTDSPIAFVGGAAVDAKPRAGFELAVIQFDVDSVGLGTGTMAAAARVRPGGPAGVQIDDYAEAPIKLVTVRKSLK